MAPSPALWATTKLGLTADRAESLYSSKPSEHARFLKWLHESTERARDKRDEAIARGQREIARVAREVRR